MSAPAIFALIIFFKAFFIFSSESSGKTYGFYFLNFASSGIHKSGTSTSERAAPVLVPEKKQTILKLLPCP
jgi:hypothetical protein